MNPHKSFGCRHSYLYSFLSVNSQLLGIRSQTQHTISVNSWKVPFTSFNKGCRKTPTSHLYLTSVNLTSDISARNGIRLFHYLTHPDTGDEGWEWSSSRLGVNNNLTNLTPPPPRMLRVARPDARPHPHPHYIKLFGLLDPPFLADLYGSLPYAI